MAKITLAKKYGFCFGVKRAIDTLEKQRGPAFTLGPIIHNPQVVSELIKSGIRPVKDIKDLKRGERIFIRAHGVPQRIIDRANKQGLLVKDLTCPYVKKSQMAAINLARAGYQVIIIGQKDHPEVKAIAGNLVNPIIMNEVHEIEKFKRLEKIGVICQTTSNIDKVKNIISTLKKKTKDIKLYDTICQATKERQIAAKELAKKSDVVIVIGGKKSSNTTKLSEICRKFVRTYQIETEAELNSPWFKKIKVVGITAGASTPDWIIKAVIRRIKVLIK